jgi:chemotaxis protein methyltransferase CheR
MRPEELTFIIQLLLERSGLALTQDKQYLVESRLTPIALAYGHKDLSGLITMLRTRPGEALLKEVTEAMTTNESSFYRDGKPFEQLRAVVLPQIRQNAGTRRNLRVWSAACSNGQEPYTIAMTTREENLSEWKYEILATDLAEKVVNKAKLGVYSQFEVQRGMPIQLLLKYFKQETDLTWQIKEELRAAIQFRTQNLLKDYTLLGRFDLIFCRNVLIYFNEETKGNVIEAMCNILQPRGFLFLGSTEAITRKNTRLTELEGCRGIYQIK